MIYFLLLILDALNKPSRGLSPASYRQSGARLTKCCLVSAIDCYWWLWLLLIYTRWLCRLSY